MKRVIIVQARITSTRLPGKVMMNLAGRPMLSQQLRRLKQCRRADDIIIATTINSSDNPIVELANTEAVRWFRGDEHDVLSRYIGAAAESSADIVVRVTADCPLIDPEQIDRVIEEIETNSFCCDYAANIIERTFPQGLDTEALFRDALERTFRLAQSKAAREHVTWFIYAERPELFMLHSVVDAEDNSDLRWTVDTAEDFDLVRRVYEETGIGEGQVLTYKQLLLFVRTHFSPAVNSVARQ